MSEAVVLVAEGLVKVHGRRFRLGPLSVRITSGVTCVVGANGAGKSTLLRLASGVDRPTSGSIRRMPEEASADRLGYLPQDMRLPQQATCEEFLHYVAWLQRVPKKTRSDYVSTALSRTRLENRRGSRIRTLSGGMRQRLGVAHALVHDPDLLLLDEPSAGLDPRQRASLRETIIDNAEGRVVIVATHLVEDVRGMADRVIVIRGGSIAFDGSVPDLEREDDGSAPGGTPLERAVANVIGESE